MKRIIIYIIVLSSLAFTSCEKWFDVSPKSEVAANDLFSNENGFNDVLLGAYTLMASNELYGGEGNMLFLDVLSQSYHSLKIAGEGHKYIKAVAYDYTDLKTEEIIDNLWIKQYQIIVNCNILLSYIDDKKDVFTKTNYEVLKAEAIALRALIHFDLLRLFGPMPQAGGSLPAIPYANEYTINSFPTLSFDEVAERIIADLIEAKDLLKVSDPIMDEESTLSQSSILWPRNGRMNYYAVTGALAKVYLYINNKAEAKKMADTVLLSEAFSMLEFADIDPIITGEKTRTIETEQLFGIYAHNLETELFEVYFDPNIVISNPNLLRFDKVELDAMFNEDAGGNSDYRNELWIDDISGESILAKYQYEYRIPILKLSEMYLIAAECSGDLSTGLTNLNGLRTHRGLPDITGITIDQLQDYIDKEYRKEFLGEGQLFYFYKRRAISKLPGIEEFTDLNSIYVLPIPEQELEFGS